jgi:hypothetical protein
MEFGLVQNRKDEIIVRSCNGLSASAQWRSISFEDKDDPLRYLARGCCFQQFYASA